MPTCTDTRLSLEALTSELQGDRPADPDYLAWEAEILREAARDLDADASAGFSHEAVFHMLDEIIAAYEQS
ncbi:MAG: hypothetical protein GVY13_12655 [Alphaproteobacteria bacterium]|jgi:hypothetical protein|nr:hypothetical protein [Alphaproteobacteria bacterium]